MVRIQRCFRQALPHLLVFAGVTACSAQQFLPDDPLTRTPEVAAVRQTSVQDINALYDFAHNSLHYKSPVPTESLGVNTLGEVPDSSWFTNRDISSLSIGALKKGARVHGGPQPPYTVVAAKTEGVSTGFRIRDARGLLYFVKADPPSNPEMATAADVMGALFLYAAGYNVPENYIMVGRTDEFRLSEKSTVRAAYGKDHRLTAGELRQIFDRIPRERDGRIRLVASLSLPPKIAGPFRYAGVRSDDPNDLVPHQQRRDLRGLAVLFAWLNHTDAKGDNSLDTVEGEGENARFVHHLLDFGDCFGSDSDIAKDPRHGQEYIVLPIKWSRMYKFGLSAPTWETVHYPHDMKAVGNFTATAFDPLAWKANYPNPAFVEMTPLDGYWGARRVMSFRDEQIRAIVEEGQFQDPKVVDYITRVLESRRDAIGRAWFRQVLPLEGFRIVDDHLAFDDLAVQSGFSSPSRYQLSWFVWHNEVQQKEDVSTSENSVLPNAFKSLAVGSYIGCRIALEHADKRSVTIYFRHEGGNWKLVGISRATA
ncbi:MAG: hypothetical protein WCA20_27285 [Candidatus Sulfotelmatobacter sp.]